MRLLTKFFSSSTRDLAPPQAVPEVSAPRSLVSFPLPHGHGVGDMEGWHLQMKPAAALVSEVGQMESLQDVKKGEKFIGNGPSLPVRPSTLLDATRGGSGPVLSERLHANLLGDGIVAMATPTQSQSRLWQHSMDEHQVTHVVRLGSELETVLLDLIPRTATPSPKGLQPAGSTPDGRHWYVTLDPNHAIPPSMMLRVFRELAADPPQPGCQVAFQSPSGDDRSAVFAAGWKIYQDVSRLCKRGKGLDHEAIQNVVLEAVLKLKSNRSSQLLNEPVHVAALLALAHTVRDTFQLRGTPHPSEIKELQCQAAAPAQATAGESSSTRHARVARDICNRTKQIRWATAQLYAPLKGSTGQPHPIRIDRMFPVDPLLKGLPDARLLGAWATASTLILEPTGPKNALALAVACMKHNIAAVVDVGGRSEPAAGHAMACGTQTVEENSFATFEWGKFGEVPLDDPLGATTTCMEVSAYVRGTQVLRDVSRDPTFVASDDISPSRRPMELVRAPLTAGKAVPPQELVAIGKLMEWFRSNGAGTPVIVQCPAGDWRGVMAAAADKLYSRFQEGALLPDRRDEVVEGIWTDLCTHYSMDLADEPDQLASLLGMADLLVAHGKATGRW